MEEKKVKIKMLKSQIGREGVHTYKARMFEKGKVYEVTESLAKSFLSIDTKHGEPAAEKAKMNAKAEPKEKKMVEPEENK
jgi:hypothetical protein